MTTLPTTSADQAARAGDGNLPADRAALVERIKALAGEYADRNHGTIFGKLDSITWCQFTEALDQLAAAPAASAPAQRVCHMECDGCISSGKCAHAEKARRDADHDLWMNDYFTLLGDAEIRRAGGETDMPAYLLDLAERIAKTHLDGGYVQRINELRAAHFQAPATVAGSQP